MNFKNLLKKLNYINFFNFYNYTIVNKIIKLKYFDTKLKLTNSFQANFLLKRFLSRSMNLKKLREVFFNSSLFVYLNDLEKKNIINYIN